MLVAFRVSFSSIDESHAAACSNAGLGSGTIEVLAMRAVQRFKASIEQVPLVQE